MTRSLLVSLIVVMFLLLSNPDGVARQNIKKPVKTGSVTGTYMGCGFGFNVEPDGTYLRVSSKPPKF